LIVNCSAGIKGVWVILRSQNVVGELVTVDLTDVIISEIGRSHTVPLRPAYRFESVAARYARPDADGSPVLTAAQLIFSLFKI